VIGAAGVAGTAVTAELGVTAGAADGDSPGTALALAAGLMAGATDAPSGVAGVALQAASRRATVVVNANARDE
jgi:hypothetical protein